MKKLYRVQRTEVLSVYVMADDDKDALTWDEKDIDWDEASSADNDLTTKNMTYDLALPSENLGDWEEWIPYSEDEDEERTCREILTAQEAAANAEARRKSQPQLEGIED